jgi:hypothetical protein
VIRNNASTRARGCQFRRDEVLLHKKLGYEKWKQIKDAGRRWIAEIVFSSSESNARVREVATNPFNSSATKII